MEGRTEGDEGRKARLIIPVIGRHIDGYEMDGNKIILKKEGCTVTVQTENETAKPEPVFFLAGGFEAWKLNVIPDEQGHFRVVIKAE